LLQLLIDAAQFVGVLKTVRREAKPSEHSQQDQPVPKLQL